jgi:peptide/nickel transport system permease protein
VSAPYPALPRLWGFSALRYRKGRALRAIWGTATGRLGLLGAALVLGTIAVGSFRGVRPNAVAVNSEYLAPSWSHPLGTDAYGRDELARLAAGGRASLTAAALIVVMAMVVALVVGITAGMLGGVVDAVLMRVDDAVLAIPTLVFAMGLLAALGPGLSNLVLALSISYAAEFTRMVRSFTLSSRRRADITSARLAGLGWCRVVVSHVLPDVTNQLLVVSTLSFGGIIVSLASLSFLGLGAQPPTAEWGSMLTGSQVTFTSAPWLVLAPGLAIVLSTLSVNLIADSLREKESAAEHRPTTMSVGATGQPETGRETPIVRNGMSVYDLRVRYGNGTEALRGVSLMLAPQKITAVVGESGSGKSTLALAALGMLPRDAMIAGSLRVAGQEIVGAHESVLRAVRGRILGYVAQDPRGSFNPLRSVGSVVREAWLTHHVRPAASTVVKSLEDVGIERATTLYRRRPHEWSGGMLQRGSIVAANAHHPPVIVADEPTSALDTDRADAILSELPKTGAAILLVSHDLGLVRAHSDFVSVLYGGRIVEQGVTEQVLDHPRHPYTRGLLAASPRPNAGLPEPLPGSPVRLTSGSKGCSFAPRCPLAAQTCHERDPELQKDVACWYPIETAQNQADR